MDIKRVETELKNRLTYPYKWGRKQLDSWDSATSFIYKTYSFKALLQKTENLDDNLKNYAYNRWYNYWSAMAVESIFTSHKNVENNQNKYDKLVDFRINNIAFDHKTSVFPRGFTKTYSYAINNKKELINWLYKNQSKQGREHYGNRLFIILFDSILQEHWKMKAEVLLLEKSINKYMKSFSKDNLIKLDFGQGEVLSDIIWIKK